MGASHIAAIAIISLSGLWPFSCSKAPTSTTEKPHAPSPSPVVATTNRVVAVSANTKNLGELSLTNRHETCVRLDASKSCLITPKLLDHDNLQLTMVLQFKSTDGKPAGFIVTQVVTHPGQPFEVAVGDIDITLTPEIVQE